MSSTIENATIKHKRDTAGNWTSNNPTLAQGEWGYETDTGFLKMGDGSTAWTSLDYQPNPAEVDAKPTGTTAQLCKAWVNFDGTTNTAGKCTIRDSYNVTDVDDNGTGDYTINFTNAMSNALFSTFGMASEDAIGSIFMSLQSTDGAATINSIRVKCYTDGGAVNDRTTITVQVFGS